MIRIADAQPSAPGAAGPPLSRPVAPPVTPGGLAGSAAAKAPPFLLPGEHFAAALVFFVVGAMGLVALAPDLARGMYATQRLVGVAHLFTLGWITTSIMGALYQFLPVALGEPIRSLRLAHASYALYVPGLAAFVSGLVSGVAALMLVGAAMFGTGIVLFAGNLIATLRRAKRRDVTWWALTGAVTFLLATLAIGLALAGNLRWGYLGAGRMGAVGVHLHVAIAGWVLLVMVGVAHRLLPMFLLSHGAGERPARAAVALIAAGAGVLAVLNHAPLVVSRWLPSVLLAGGLACFLAQARAFYRHRRRPALDPGMRLAAVALGLLGVALALAGPVLLGMATQRLATAYVLTLVLGIALFVSAHYYKIVPFLVWYHRFGPLAGKQPVPRVAELYSARVATAAGVMLVLGVAGLILAVTSGSIMATRAAATLFAAGAATQAWQMLQLARLHP